MEGCVAEVVGLSLISVIVFSSGDYVYRIKPCIILMVLHFFIFFYEGLGCCSVCQYKRCWGLIRVLIVWDYVIFLVWWSISYILVSHCFLFTFSSGQAQGLNINSMLIRHPHSHRSLPWLLTIFTCSLSIFLWFRSFWSQWPKTLSKSLSPKGFNKVSGGDHIQCFIHFLFLTRKGKKRKFKICIPSTRKLMTNQIGQVIFYKIFRMIIKMRCGNIFSALPFNFT